MLPPNDNRCTNVGGCRYGALADICCSLHATAHQWHVLIACELRMTSAHLKPKGILNKMLRSYLVLYLGVFYGFGRLSWLCWNLES